MKKIVIIGATSAIAIACARLWAAEQSEFFLVGRHQDKLQQTSADLVARGAQAAHSYVLDLIDFQQHAAMLTQALQTLGQIDVILIAHGTLPDQHQCEQDVHYALQEFNNNALSVLALLTPVANHMAQQGFGTIAVISSVAGDRGRGSNYLYGSAKAAVTTFCEGLRARMFKVGVHVLTIKPGFVATPMTADLNLPAKLTVSPEVVAKDIVQAIAKRKDVLYTPWFWAWIMKIIIHIPRGIFKKLKL